MNLTIFSKGATSENLVQCATSQTSLFLSDNISFPKLLLKKYKNKQKFFDLICIQKGYGKKEMVV